MPTAGQRRRFRAPWTTIAFLAPSLVAYAAFKYYPLASMMYMSLFDYRIVDPPGPFVGLRNYADFLGTETFWLAVRNTFVFFFLSLGLTFWIPLLQALLLLNIRRANSFYRFMYQVPAVLPAVAGVLVWKWMYNPDRGLLNYLLGRIGLGPYGWLNDLSMTKLAIVLPGFFTGGGISLLLYYAALRSIPAELVEAAKIDGAGPWRRIGLLLLPNIRFLIVIQFIGFMSGSLLAFDNIYVMTQGGPANSTLVVAMLIVRSAFEQSRFGYASALSFFMFAVIAVLTVIQQRVTRERD